MCKKLCVLVSILCFLCLLWPICLAPKCSLAQEVSEIHWNDLLLKDWSKGDASLDQKKLDQLANDLQKAAPNPAYDQKVIRIQGFVVPVDRDAKGNLHTLLLVPYFGACIHVPPPPENQIIYVELATPKADVRSMDNLLFEGRLILQSTDTVGTKTAYKMEGAKIIVAEQNAGSDLWAAVLLTCVSSLSICLGWILPLKKIQISPTIYAWVVAIASGMMLCLGLTSVFVKSSTTKTLLFVIAFVVMYAWGKFSERVSDHDHHEPLESSNTAIACALHNFPECFFILSTAIGNFSVGALLTSTMMAHNIPLGLSLGLISQNIDKFKRLKYIFFAGILPPIFVLLAYLSLRQFITIDTIRQIYPLAGGCLVSIALFHLLPSIIKKHQLIGDISYPVNKDNSRESR